METIGERLKKARTAEKMSQKYLSAISGVSQQMISKLESGKALSTSDIFPLARALRITPEWLAEGSGHMRPALPAASYELELLLTPRQHVLVELFEALTDVQQEALIRDLEEKKRLNEEMLSQLLARKGKR